jgi:hypothetical protein
LDALSLTLVAVGPRTSDCRIGATVDRIVEGKIVGTFEDDTMYD